MTHHDIVEQAIRGTQAGSKDAFRALYDELHGELYTYVVRRVATKDDALDVLQDIFLELWKMLPAFEYQGRPAFYRYVYTITRRRLARDYAKSMGTASLDDIPEPASDDPHPEVLERTVLLRALGFMREPDRSIIELRYWSGLPFKDIAERLGLSETSTKVRHHRALRALQKVFIHHEAN